MRSPLRPGALAVLVIVILDLLSIGYVLGQSLQRSTPNSSRASPAPAVWRKVGPSTLVHAILVDPSRHTRLFAATSGGVLRSDDGGATWHARNTGLPTDDRQIWSLITFDGGRRLAAAADDAHVYLSADAGNHWRTSGDALGDGSVFALAANPAHPMTLLAGGTGGIWRSGDGGLRWRLARSTGGSDVSAITWPSTVPGIIYAGLVPGPGQILQSRDGGTNWRSLTMGLDGTEGIMAIAGPLRGRGSMLAGAMGHRIWRLEADAGTWHFSGDGLPIGQHGASLLVTADAEYAGTMGAGVYLSHDGQHWAAFGPTLTGNAAIVIALAQYGQTLLIGTADGMYQLSMDSALPRERGSRAQ